MTDVTDNVGEPGSVWRGDAVSAYPSLEKVRINEAYGKGHKRARLPRWGGKHGSIVKGSIVWSPTEGAWSIVFSYLLGYETTLRAREKYHNWTVAKVEYIEHDRKVRERKKLEDFRSVRAVL